ncbi:alpha-hydroxy-acid oxidizing protein [Aliamphritea spongicola]|nr:alpha-hydroxy-acid oxidizing protein [Aliamphritea spongicola]
MSTLASIRKQWQGKLIVKGILTAEDAKRAIAAEADGLIISNHGGRQLDAAVPSLQALKSIRSSISRDTALMVDGGVESGVDIARYLACGADAVFAGRAFMYGVAGLGNDGADYTAALLRRELQQVMEQLRCPTIADLPRFLK